MRMKQEARENGKSVNENRPMKEERSFGKVGSDSDHSIQKAGGEDPRRYEAKQIIERKISDHSQSGYNHNATSTQPANGGHENEMYMSRKDAEVDRTPEIQPDGRMGMGRSPY